MLGIRALAALAPGEIEEADLILPDEESLDAEIVDLGLLASTEAERPAAIAAWLAASQRFPPDDSSLELARRAAALGSVDEEFVSNEMMETAHADAWSACRNASDIIAAFDWLALAEHELTIRRNDQPSERATSLRAVRDALLIRQIDRNTQDDDGGIPLRRSGVEIIDARNLRLMLALAVIDGLPGDDDAGRSRSRRGLDGLFRLVRQLMLDDEEAADLLGGRTATGGVSSGLYEPRQPLAATATAILAINHLKPRSSGGNASGGSQKPSTPVPTP